MLRRRTLGLSITLGAALAAFPAPLPAQHVGASAGLAVPLGSLAEHRGVGFRAQGSVHSPGGRVRLDAGGMLFPGSETAGVQAERAGDWRSFWVGASVLPTLGRSSDLRVRGLVGLAAHRTSIRGASNPYGTAPGFQLGGVLERTRGRATLTAEIGLHAVASDFGVDEMHGAFSVPLQVGVRW